AHHPVRPVLARGVQASRSNQFAQLFPLGAAITTLAARLLHAQTLLFVANYGSPSLHRIRKRGLRFLPHVVKRTADVWILYPDRAVDIPGGGDATLAATRLIGRQTALKKRIVGLLHLPGDDPVFYVDRPGAATGAVDAMRTAENVIMRPAVAVELFPLALPRINEVKYPA